MGGEGRGHIPYFGPGPLNFKTALVFGTAFEMHMTYNYAIF